MENIHKGLGLMQSMSSTVGDNGKEGDAGVGGASETDAAKWDRIAENLYPWRTGFRMYSSESMKKTFVNIIKENAEIIISMKRCNQDILDRSFFLNQQDRPDQKSEHPLLINCGKHIGGVYTTYSHIMPGLLLNRVVPSLCYDKKDMHVLCMGWKFNTHPDCWLQKETINADSDSDSVINAILECKALEEITKNKHPKDLNDDFHLRVVVWLLEKRHAFAVGWNVYKNGKGEFLSHVFEINSSDRTDFVLKIMEKLPDKLKTYYGEEFVFNRLNQPPITDGQAYVDSAEGSLISDVVPCIQDQLITIYNIGVTEEFPCVPFMARCTMYLSFLKNLEDIAKIDLLVDCMDLSDEKNLYHQFETYLVDLAENVIRKKKHLLLVPAKICGEKIVNINDICLEEVDPVDTHFPPIKFEFSSFDTGFTVMGSGSDDKPSACSYVQSRFPTPALSAIRECRMLLLRALMLRR